MRLIKLDIFLLFLFLLSLSLFFSFSKNYFVSGGKIEEGEVENGIKMGNFVFSVFSFKEMNCTARVFLYHEGSLFFNTTKNFNVKAGKNLIKIKIPLPEGKNKAIADVKCK